MYKSFLILLILFLNLSYSVENDFVWEKELEINEKLNNPASIFIYNNNIFIIDYNNIKPVVIFNTKGKFIGYMGKWGHGPGEIQKGNNEITFAGKIKNELFLYSSMERKCIAFNINNFKFIRYLNLSKINSFKIIIKNYKLIALNNSFNPFLIHTFTLDQKFNIKKSNNYWGSFSQIPESENCAKNFFLNQGELCTDKQGNIYFASHFSSLVLSFSSSGDLLFKTLKPFSISLPNYMGKDELSSPPLNKYPYNYVSIATDNKYLYAIYSGFIFKNVNLSAFDMYNITFDHGNIMVVFDKHNGKIIAQIKLPLKVKTIQVTDNSFYFLTTDKKIALLKYKKDKIFK